MRCLYAGTFGTVLENVVIIKLRRLKSTRAGACIIQILQELELEPALLKIKRTGEVSNLITNEPVLGVVIGGKCQF